jgi:hypothetical protein
LNVWTKFQGTRSTFLQICFLFLFNYVLKKSVIRYCSFEMLQISLKCDPLPNIVASLC